MLPLVKPPNVSGTFYPSSPESLKQVVDGFLSSAQIHPSATKIHALVCPHAGYVYSGKTAAYAYRFAQQQNPKTILILSPSHFYAFSGIAIWPEGAFATPLGKVLINSQLSQKLMAQNQVCAPLLEAFEREHALEVQLPFIQRTFPEAQIVPILFGQPDYAQIVEFANALHSVLSDSKDTLIIVSSDMSHYHDLQTAQQLDSRTLSVFCHQDTERYWQACRAHQLEMCGYVGAAALLLWSELQNLNNFSVLHTSNSASYSNNNHRVVGYASIALT